MNLGGGSGSFRVLLDQDAIDEGELGEVHVKTVDVQIHGITNNCSNGITNSCLKEIGILRALDHPHVIELKGVVMNEREQKDKEPILSSLGLVFPKMECDLEKYMKKASEMKELNLLPGSELEQCLYFG